MPDVEYLAPNNKHNQFLSSVYVKNYLQYETKYFYYFCCPFILTKRKKDDAVNSQLLIFR